MRPSEWIQVVVCSYFVALAWMCPLPMHRRVRVCAMGIAAAMATVGCARLLPHFAAPLTVSVARDWLPAGLVLPVYWQAGAFFVRVDQRFQDRLERFDERITGPMFRWIAHLRAGRWIAACLELAYLLCYPMVPMSLGALYLLRLGRHADYFWTVALVSTYVSYCVLPFLQTLPPRKLHEPWLVPLPPNEVRTFNLWILRHGSIHANTFPSAHVAASVSAALVVATLAPWPVGLAFAVIATGIALGTFAGRYHYAADSIAGCVVAGLVFLGKVLLAGLPR